jgi:hypothetical protein
VPTDKATVAKLLSLEARKQYAFESLSTQCGIPSGRSVTDETISVTDVDSTAITNADTAKAGVV